MLSMILRMTAVTSLFVMLTALIWKRTESKPLTLAGKWAIGLIFGLFSVFSTHFGIDFETMMLNVRDMGPLAAGLFFDPLSGIIAGLIGGIERYIAGTYWGVGSYTRIACSVSTCLAGFLAAFQHIFIFKKQKPSGVYAFFMGAVMEVFHMYAVLITHRSDMNMAFFVVRVCALPMILFTGLGLAACSIAIRVWSGEWRSPFRKRKPEETPVTHQFQAWLFVGTFAILALNQLFSFSIQTQSAIQEAHTALTTVAGDIAATYRAVHQTEVNTDVLAEKTACMEAQAIAEAVDRSGGIPQADDAFLERMRQIYSAVSVAAVNDGGSATASAGDSPVYAALLSEVLAGKVPVQAVNPSEERTAAGARCQGGMIQVVVDERALADALNLSSLNESLSFFHVGTAGSFDLIRESGLIAAGDHKGTTLTGSDLDLLMRQLPETYFNAELFGEKSIALTRRLDDGLTLLVRLPMEEVYASRNVTVYESLFAAIILFAVIYVLTSLLVEHIVLNNLQRVNTSLDRITQGHLDETVSVRHSAEFAALSDGINHMVNALKGYIEAAAKRIEKELELARTIQDAALPKNFTFPRHEFEIYALMDPAKEVGGDFYDFFFVGPNQLALVIADVSGKGIPASLFMMRSKTAIRGLAQSGMAPSEILHKANNTLCEGNDAEMFVTVWLGILDLTTGAMRCANAGHEYPALLRSGGDYELYKEPHGLALAAMEDMPFKDYELQLNPGDRLFVYTDGVPEAINEAEEQYGTERMLKKLNAVKDSPLSGILPALRKDIDDFAGSAEQFDDITMLGLTYFGKPADSDRGTHL